MAKAFSFSRARVRARDGANTEARSYALSPEVWKRLEDEAQRLEVSEAVLVDACITHWFLAGMKTPTFVVALESRTGRKCWQGTPKEADALGGAFTCQECGEMFVKAKDGEEFLIVGQEEEPPA